MGPGRDNTRDNIQCVQPVQSVHGISQFGRLGRRWMHLQATVKVEGLVDCMVRGGSSPLGRTRKAPEIMRFRGDSEGDLERNA